MNKKEVEDIGYILSLAEVEPESRHAKWWLEKLCSIDPRIREEYEAFCDTRIDYNSIGDEVNEKLTDEFGGGWPMLKAAKARHSELFAQAEAEHKVRLEKENHETG